MTHNLTDVSTKASPSAAPMLRQRAAVFWVAIWLVFLGSPLQAIWNHPGGWARDLGLVCLFGYAATYVGMFAVLRLSWRTQESGNPKLAAGGLLLLAAMLAGTAPAAGSSCLVLVAFLGAAAMFSLPLPWGWLVVVPIAVGTEVSARLVPGWQDQQWGPAFSVLFAAVAVFGVRLAIGRNVALLQARERLAEMAVEEERARMTRDLHDILGHSLTVITVKAELAGRLVALDPDRAEREIDDVERLARDALADVRATIQGRREITLPSELINARSALAAADIDADVSQAVDEVHSRDRELFAWAVREGVTNVVRHSKATRCRVRLTATSVEVHDDGVGESATALDGHGLAGLRERVRRVGGLMTTGRSHDLGGFCLRVSTDGGGDVEL